MQATQMRFASFTGLATARPMSAQAARPAAGLARSGERGGLLRADRAPSWPRPRPSSPISDASPNSHAPPPPTRAAGLVVEARTHTRREQLAKRHKRVRGKVRAAPAARRAHGPRPRPPALTPLFLPPSPSPSRSPASPSARGSRFSAPTRTSTRK